VKEIERMKVCYYGDQCPWNSWARGEARKAADALGLSIEEFDLTHPSPPVELFFPFSILLKGITIAGPVPARRLIDILKTGKPSEYFEPYSQNPKGSCDSIRLYSSETIADACRICTNGDDFGIAEKRAWLERFDSKDRLCAGALAYSDGSPVAFCEAIPSLESPYAIPAEGSMAFINCIYNAMAEPLDYRAGLLEFFLGRLKALGYSKVGVLSGLRAPFPNGPESFFLEMGFTRTRRIPGTILMNSGIDEIVFLSREL